MKPRFVVYDLDDTLFPNHHFFVDRKKRFLTTLLNGASAEEYDALKKQLEQTSNSLIPSMGYSPERIGEAMRRTYRDWQKNKGQPIDGELSDQLYGLGLSVANPHEIRQTGLYPGAMDVLAFHQDRRDHLMPLTKGKHWTQDMKITVLNLRREFDYIKIVDGINEEKFQIPMPEWKEYKGRLLTVGNSYKSDILPALKHGFSGIHMDTDTWDHEKVSPEQIPQNIPSFKTMPELLKYLKSL